MNVATKLLLQRMEQDIESLKQRVAELEATRVKPSNKRTLSLPEKRPSV
jgi:hypothetical protein